jgi:hypothetical protein
MYLFSSVTGIDIYLFKDTCSRGSCFGIMTRLLAGRPRSRNSIPGRGNRFFSSPKLPDRLWGPPSLLFTSYQWLFSWGSSSRGMNLTMKANVGVEVSLHCFLSAALDAATWSALRYGSFISGKSLRCLLFSDAEYRTDATTWERKFI